MGAKPYALYNENDDHAADWLENLIALGVIAPGIVDRRSIEDLRGDDLRGFRQVHLFAGIGVWSYSLRCAGISDDTAVWTGSCPCQPFSAAGKGAGMDDERHLWPAFLHLIGECRPDIVLGEQVASADGLGWLDLVQTDLEAASYAIGAVDTCSAGSGAPHIRQRLRFSAYDLRSSAGGIQHSTSDGRLERRAEPSRGSLASGRGSMRMADCESFGSANGSSVIRGSGQISATAKPFERVGDRRSAGGMADCDSDEQRQGGNAGSSEGEGVWSEPRRCGQSVGMDNNDDEGLEGFGSGHQTSIRHGQGSVRPASATGEFGWLADTYLIDDDGAGLGASNERREFGRSEILSGFEDIIGMADADDGPISVSRRGSQGRNGSAAVDAEFVGASPTNGFWRDADWLFCRDGKWRPVEPGTFPLVDGSAFRVGSGSAFEGKSRQGILKGYGNAIDAEATRVFVEACADFFVDLDARRVKTELIGDLL